MKMDSLNCSYGSLVVWDNLVNCVVDKYHVTGQILSGVAVPLWSSAHICHYVILRSRVKSASSTRIMTFLFTHWLSECIGVVSAFLAQQWLSQILFGMCLLMLHTICCMHYMLAPLPTQTNIVAIDKKLTVRSRSRLKNCPHMLSLLFLPAVIFTIHGDVLPTNNYMRAIKQPTASAAVTDFHIPHIVGYVFGSLSGVLYCAVGLIDMLDSYITVESSTNLIVSYIIRILSECIYVSSIFIQNNTIYDHIRTSPWSVPRLVSTGLNIGVSFGIGIKLFKFHSSRWGLCMMGLITNTDKVISILRSVQKRKGKRRKLSKEDAECLLSSESETEFHCDDSDEEVIWMPLKSVQSAIPTHPVCVSRVQIISEADVPPDVTSSQDEEPERPSNDKIELAENHQNDQSRSDKQKNDDDVAVNQDNYN